MALEKAVRKTILPSKTKRHFEKSFSSLLLLSKRRERGGQ